MSITEDKAYILGLFVGGGVISDSTFHIILPFKKWGGDPNRMSNIATDILSNIQSKFRNSFGISINYQIHPEDWTITPNATSDLTELKNELSKLDLPDSGRILDRCDLGTAKTGLKGIFAEFFLSGIFDARASLAKSHRRFSDAAPVVSIEIPGSTGNFKFVVHLCEWLTDLGSITDQILFNHPCQHSPFNPSYKNWKKGFKIRFLVRSFLKKHSFALQSKATDVTKLKISQKSREQLPCIKRTPKPGYISIHSDVSSPSIPPEVRSKLFLHYHHICAVMGCKYAPSRAVEKMVRESAFSSICPFPVLLKGCKEEVVPVFELQVRNKFPDSQLLAPEMTCENILRIYPRNIYPEIESAMAFLFSGKLRGNRHVGKKQKIISGALGKIAVLQYLENVGGSPILIVNESNKRAVIVASNSSPEQSMIVKRLISVEGMEIKVN